jgi:hypothetical protein
MKVTTKRTIELTEEEFEVLHKTLGRFTFDLEKQFGLSESESGILDDIFAGIHAATGN